jgi:hypothetical protein
VRLHIFVEGGGDTQHTLRACRRAFGQLFEKIAPTGSLPKISACGGRDRTFRDFCIALKNLPAGDSALLLIDAEGPVENQFAIWAYLKTRDGWERPGNSSNDQVHLIVQCMESWFLADPGALSDYYGQSFLAGALPKRHDIEQVAKRAVAEGLKRATRHCQAGEYHKTRHGFEILPRLDPVLIRAASPHFQRLFDMLA